MAYCGGEQGAPQGAAIFNRRRVENGDFKSPLLEALSEHAASKHNAATFK
jgi:hypothetical protein